MRTWHRPPRATLSAAVREQERAKQRDYTRRERATCTVCGGPMGIGSREDGTCRPCDIARAAADRARVGRLWEAGHEVPEITAALGLNLGTTKKHLQRLRADARAAREQLEPDSDAARIIDRYLAGTSYAEIARIFETTPQAVGMRLDRLRKRGHDLPRRRPPGRSLFVEADDGTAALIAAYRAGETMVDIGAGLGISRAAVNMRLKRLRANGVDLPKRRA